MLPAVLVGVAALGEKHLLSLEQRGKDLPFYSCMIKKCEEKDCDRAKMETKERLMELSQWKILPDLSEFNELVVFDPDHQLFWLLVRLKNEAGLLMKRQSESPPADSHNP